MVVQVVVLVGMRPFVHPLPPVGERVEASIGGHDLKS